jgi:hypothetical protein
LPGSRQSWKVSFRSRDFREEQQRPAGDDDGMRPCSRGEWCASADRVRLDDGTTRRTPAMAYRAFCDTDRDLAGAVLDGFPALHGRLAAAIGDFTTAELLIRVPFGPSVLLRSDVDGLMRHMVEVACSWHERVAAVAGLAPPDTQATRARELGLRSGGLLGDACKVLCAHLDALLSLEPEPMTRPRVSWLSSVIPAAVVSGGWRDCLTVCLGGADAGNELLRLDFLGRAALLETEPAPLRLLGVPCRGCERRTLRRAAPPQHDGDPEWYSQCAWCRDVMDAAEYEAWVKANAAYYEQRVTPAQVAAGRVAMGRISA